jgi:transcriptional activator SPT7
MFTRVAADHLRNLGQTFRLLIDGFSKKMPSDVSAAYTVELSP